MKKVKPLSEDTKKFMKEYIDLSKKLIACLEEILDQENIPEDERKSLNEICLDHCIDPDKTKHFIKNKGIRGLFLVDKE